LGSNIPDPLPAGFERLLSVGSIPEKARWILARFAFALNHGLDALPKPAQLFPDIASACPSLVTKQPTLEKCLTAGLICFANMRWSLATDYVAALRGHTMIREGLAQALPSSAANDDNIDCLVWLWMLLVCSYRIQGALIPQLGLSRLEEFKVLFAEWQLGWTKIESAVLPNFFWRDSDSVALRMAWGS
jgi:hypothetical protein